MRTSVFYVFMATSAVSIVYFGILLLQSGNLTSAMIPIVASPVMMFVLRVVGEPDMSKNIFDLRTQFWGFVLGDVVALPIAFLGISLAWRRSDLSIGFGGERWWLVASLLIALLIAVAWGVLQRHDYAALNAEDLLCSPTKLWHDDVVYPSLAFLLVYTGIPVLAHDFGAGAIIAVVGIALWVSFGACDMSRHVDVRLVHASKQNTILRK